MFRGALMVLLLRLGLVAGIHTVLRIAFVLHNGAFFPDVPLISYIGGVRFDLFALAWLNLPWVLLYLARPVPNGVMGRIQFWVFLLANALGLFFNTVDVGYYPFSLKRSTADLLSILTTGGDVVGLGPAFLSDYWYLLLTFLAGIGLMAFGYQWIGRLSTGPEGPIKQRIFWRVMAVSILLLAARGGTQLIPLQPMDAAAYGGPAFLPVVLSTPYTMLVSLGKPTLQERAYMPQEEADLIWPVLHHPLVNDPSLDTTWDGPPNVVVIILESFSSVYSGILNGGDGYMPFLDASMREGLTFTRAYANGRRSIDGIPAILASLPELMDEAFITSAYASRPFTSLANVLASKGYSTSFYHGGRNGTMGFEGFARSAGYDRYVGLDQYPKGEADHDGHWGIRDLPFLQFWARELEKEPEPFFSTVFTLSSHHPYELAPEDAERFAGGGQAIHPTLRYTDEALRRFFSTAREMPWFGNTLFVITADHTADIERSGQHSAMAVDYWIPLVFIAPGKVEPRMDDKVVQHIDILPTVLDLIGHDKPYFSFGHSALRPTRTECAVWANNGLFSITKAEGQLQFDGEQVVAINGSMPGSLEQDRERVAAMERQLKAALQQFSIHLLNGTMTTNSDRP